MNKGSEAIKKLRKDLGLTQVQFAALIGCNQGEVSIMETGKRGVTATYLERIAKATGTTLWIEFVHNYGQ